MSGSRRLAIVGDMAIASRRVPRWVALVELGLGLAAIVWPIAAAAGFALLVGCVFLTAGTIGLATAHRTKGGALAVRLSASLLSVAAGAYLVVDPDRTVLGLTTLLAIFLAGVGAVKIVAGILDGSRRVFVAMGIFDIALGTLIWANLPSSAEWALGLLVGLHFLAVGFATLGGSFDGVDDAGVTRGLEARSA